MIRSDEMLDKQINHALMIVFPKNTIRGSGVHPRYVYPASSSDGTGESADTSSPMGARLVLDPTLTDAYLIATYGMNDYDLAIAHALQRYGAYIVDSNGETNSPAFLFLNAQSTASAEAKYPITYAAWPMLLLKDHMLFVNPPFPVILDNRFQDNVVKLNE